jgi:hypothetical protein
LCFDRKNSSNQICCLCPRFNSSTSDIKTDNSPDEISKSSSGYGISSEKWKLLEPRTLTKQITLEERIGMGGYGCVYRGKWHGDVIAVKIFLSSEEASWSREVEIYKTPGLNHDNVLRYIAADNIVNIVIDESDFHDLKVDVIFFSVMTQSNCVINYYINLFLF